MTHAIVLALEPGSAAMVEGLWHRLAEAGLSHSMPDLDYPPHLTLTVLDGPVEEAALRAAFKAMLDGAPISELGEASLPVTGLGLFPGPRCVLWAAAAVPPALAALHRRLHAALPASHEDYRPGRWLPHLTLADDLDAAMVPAAMAALLPHWTAFTARLQAAELVRFPPAEVLARQPLAP
ncbi:MAG TPA: 2'-5' RNA ligase family protein [Alphaproteobacteria bacterium]|nr:2'-5' RNA ligase family protein [Alphaproteobacteria bacterium]